jgi:hypothetical protein
MPKLMVNVSVHKRHTAHLGRDEEVKFHATRACRLYFTNPAVFNKDYVDLKTGKPRTLTVVNNGQTSWVALTPPQKKSTLSNPNEIVVP